LSVDLEQYLDDRRRLIEARLSGYLDAETGTPPALVEAMRYSLLGPGKRLRPILVLMACEACGGTAEAALPAACAVEMVHTYSLVHDDLPAMDDDDLRRGRLTCHKQFGEATAILVGDALLTLAFQVMSEGVQATGLDNALAARCCSELARGAGPAGMVGGQLLDLAQEGKGGSLETLEGIHRRKTGALFRACLRIGGRIGTQNMPDVCADILVRALDGFGTAFGLAFQISDDLLDVEGTAEATGKGVGKDAGRGKLTYPGLLGVAESRRLLAEAAAAAREHLVVLGERAHRLHELMQFIVERDR
jgi:geranylgeranyl diphosphate synthase type II